MLHRSQPAITQKLKQLETILGATLVSRRQGRVMSLTEPGKHFLRAVRAGLQHLDHAIETLRDARPDGQVRLGVPPDTFAQVAPAMALARAGLRPALDMHVTVAPSCQLLQAFEQQHLDIALFWVPALSQPAVPSRPLRTEALCWAAQREHGFAKADAVPLVTFHDGHVYRTAAMDTLNQAGRLWRITCIASDIQNARTAVEAGLGVAAIPLRAIQAGLVTLDVRHGLPALPSMQLFMAVRPHHPLCEQVAEVLAHQAQRSRAIAPRPA